MVGDEDDIDQGPAEPIVSVATAPRRETRPEADTKTRQPPPYHVVILNDEEHTFDYVIELLITLFGHDFDTAVELTWRIHLAGRAVVYTTHKEKAELKRDQVLAYGPDIRLDTSKSSLRCFIEPAER